MTAEVRDYVHEPLGPDPRAAAYIDLRRVRRCRLPNRALAIEPNGCARCGHERDGHGRRNGFGLTLHEWIEPSDALRLERMLERRVLLGRPIPELSARAKRPEREEQETA